MNTTGRSKDDTKPSGQMRFPSTGKQWTRWAALLILVACGCNAARTQAPRLPSSTAAPSVAAGSGTAISTRSAAALEAPQGLSARAATRAASTASAATLDSMPALRGSETTTSIPLKITLTPSETPLKIGSTSNMAATIQNISNAPVSIITSTLMLTTPAIVGGKASKCVVDIPVANGDMIQRQEVTLQPQDTMTVLFNLSQPPRFARPVKAESQTKQAFDQSQAEQNYVTYMRSCSMGVTGPMQRVLDFSPGSYDYYLQGEFTLCNDPNQPSANPACTEPWRNFSASASFPVQIDQTTIVIFAVLGGWLALLYVIFSKAAEPGSILHEFNAALTELAPEDKSGNPFGRFWQKLMTSSGTRAVTRFLVRLVATAILSAAVTVISSRISNPSLPIRISVMDAWGSMTMGFLSYFIGAKFISSLTDWSGGNNGATPEAKSTSPQS